MQKSFRIFKYPLNSNCQHLYREKFLYFFCIRVKVHITIYREHLASLGSGFD